MTTLEQNNKRIYGRVMRRDASIFRQAAWAGCSDDEIAVMLDIYEEAGSGPMNSGADMEASRVAVLKWSKKTRDYRLPTGLVDSHHSVLPRLGHAWEYWKWEFTTSWVRLAQTQSDASSS